MVGTVNIHESHNNLFDTLLDDVSFKHDQNYRLILQNVNGIKEFHEKKLDYYPTLRALQRIGANKCGAPQLKQQELPAEKTSRSLKHTNQEG